MISVIVPVYKVEPYLQQCVDSILNQTYRDLEVLLIDDGSLDRCGEICDEYGRKDKRVRVFHTENRGLSAARNLGLQEATGEYIGFVDADDWIEPNMYEVLLKRLEETRADICVCGLWYEYFDSKNVSQLKEVVYTGKKSVCALIDGTIQSYAWNKLYCRDIFKCIKYPEGKNFEDIVTTYRLFVNARKVSLISIPEYHYRIREGSITQTHSAKNLIEYAEAHISRYYCIKNNDPTLLDENKVMLLRYLSESLSRVWRWWYACSFQEKQVYEKRLKELEKFSKSYIPLFGYRPWPLSLRVSTLFIHNCGNISIAIMGKIDQMARMLKQ